jgi:hypothetical protein
MKRFKKIKWDQKDITLLWTTESGSETHDHELTSKAAPHEDLNTALQALASDVLNVCELDAAIEDLRVQSVSLSFSEKSGLRGAVVTALKPVAIANSPVVLNTPHLTEDGEDPKAVMPASMWRRVLKLEDEAQAYLDGKRAPQDQLDAFAPPPPSETPEADTESTDDLPPSTVKVDGKWVPATPANIARAISR